VSITGRADEPRSTNGRLDGFRSGTGTEIRADFVVGADGAASRVASVAGLVAGERALWGFAVRAYHPQPVELPAIVLWEPVPRRGLAGYGWLFPGADGGANLGFGVGTGPHRQAGSAAVRYLPRFVDHLGALGLVDPARSIDRRLGGWLKMGMVGTTPAHDRVLLVGDAAGLINPMQGEGISQALQSGRWAAEAILHSPGAAAGRYRARLAAAHMPYQRITAALQGALIRRPRAVSALSRLVTTAARHDTVAGGWAVFWNELLDGAPPGSHRTIAALVTRLGSVSTARSDASRWFDAVMP
jgi:flavin-dependent dehydrogenase